MWGKFGGNVLQKVESIAVLLASSLLFSAGPSFGQAAPEGMIQHGDIRPTDYVVTNAWQASEQDVTNRIASALSLKQDALPYPTNAIP